MLGAYRRSEAQRCEHSGLIARIAQDANEIPLGPLNTLAIKKYLRSALSEIETDDLATALHSRTEGNPLFLVELVRLVARNPILTAEAIAQVQLPPGLEEALRVHVDALSAAARGILCIIAGSVIGAPSTGWFFACACAGTIGCRNAAGLQSRRTYHVGDLLCELRPR